jgi:hypothetical protein
MANKTELYSSLAIFSYICVPFTGYGMVPVVLIEFRNVKKFQNEAYISTT